MIGEQLEERAAFEKKKGWKKNWKSSIVLFRYVFCCCCCWPRHLSNVGGQNKSVIAFFPIVLSFLYRRRHLHHCRSFVSSILSLNIIMCIVFSFESLSVPFFLSTHRIQVRTFHNISTWQHTAFNKQERNCWEKYRRSGATWHSQFYFRAFNSKHSVAGATVLFVCYLLYVSLLFPSSLSLSLPMCVRL